MVGDPLNVFVEPLWYFADPAKRLYWLHLFGSLMLAGCYFWLKRSDRTVWIALRQVCELRYWWNPSTRIDYVLLFFNAALKIGVFVPLVGGQLAVALATARFIHLNIAETPALSASPVMISLLFTVTAFVLDDLTRFLTHAAMHRNAFLWRFHRLHHSATTLTPFTVFRTHPVESLINYLRSILSLGVVSGSFIWMFGPQLQVWDILGVNALGFALTFAGSNLRHSHIPLHFGWMERILISPAQHQLHHSKYHQHCNLGSYLSVWDRLAGTCVHGVLARDLEYGLRSSAGTVTPTSVAKQQADGNELASLVGERRKMHSGDGVGAPLDRAAAY